MLDEAKVDWLLGQMQLVAERAPEHLRPRRRAIVRGARAALNAVAEGLSLKALRDVLVAELGDQYPPGKAPRKPERTQLVAYDGATPMELGIIERWNAGWRVVDIAYELGCPTTVIDRVRRWGESAAHGIQPTARQLSSVATKERNRLARDVSAQ